MAGCGCIDTCSCFLQSVNDLLTISGSGDVTDPYTLGVAETAFDLTSENGAIVVTDGGPFGHTPSIALAIDPAGSAPVEITGAGLKIDCCDPGEASISGVACNDLYDNSGLYADAGATAVDPGAPSSVGVPSAGLVSAESWTRTVTNNEECSIIVAVGGNPFMSIVKQDALDFTIYDGACRLNISGGTFLGGGTQRSSRIMMTFAAGDLSGPATLSHADKLDDWAIIPAGGSRTFNSVIATTRRANIVSPTDYTFQTPYILAWRLRRQSLDVVGS